MPTRRARPSRRRSASLRGASSPLCPVAPHFPVMVDLRPVHLAKDGSYKPGADRRGITVFEASTDAGSRDYVLAFTRRRAMAAVRGACPGARFRR